MLEVSNLSKSFGSVRALNTVSFRLERGGIYLLVGPNGSGKSTLLKLIAGVLSPDSGRIEISGVDEPFLGYMPQEDAVYPDLTVLQNLRFFSMLNTRVSNEDGWNDMLHGLKLHRKVNTPASELSGGMRRALSFACTLAARPDVMILDEPTTGFDYTLEEYFWQALRRRAEDGVIIIMSSHSPSAISRADRVMVLKDGELLGSLSPEDGLMNAGIESLIRSLSPGKKEGEA